MNAINSNSSQINNGVPIEPPIMNFDKNSKIEAPKIPTSNIEKKQAEIKQNNKNNDLDPAKIAESVETANKLVLIFDKSIKFVYNQKTGVTFIDIIDNNTDKVIRKIPSDDMRRFLKSVESAIGMIVDEKV